MHASGESGNGSDSETLAESTTSPEQVPPTYAKPFRQGHKNDFRDAHAVAEAVQRPITRFVPAKTNEQLDLQALHRVRSRLVSERTAMINQIRGFLLERGIIVRQGLRFLRQLLPDILAKRTDVLSPRMVRTVSDLAGGWRQHNERIETVTDEIEAVAKSNDSCRKVMTVPGIGPETEPSSGASPSAATVTCACSSCKQPGSFCCGRRTGPSTASGLGSFAPLSACIRMFWRLPSPTSWRGSPGPCWRKSAPMKRASRRQRPEMNTLKFTKGMAVAPHRNRRSPHWANERRWL